MLVREEKVEWVIVEGSLYKRTTLVRKEGVVPGRGYCAPSYVSEFVRTATAQDIIGNV